jgi:aminoglycoside 6'-N-acetyltransferase
MPITFVPLTRADFGLVSQWLAEPAVDRWWHDDPSLTGIEAQYGPSVDGVDPTEVFIAWLDGQPLGLIQRYRIDDEPEWGRELRAACEVPPGTLSMDYFVADPARRGQGLGSRMIAALVADAWSVFPDAPTVIVPVAAANRRSARALERAGFRWIASGQLTPDNPIDPPDHEIFRIDRPRSS